MTVLNKSVAAVVIATHEAAHGTRSAIFVGSLLFQFLINRMTQQRKEDMDTYCNIFV